MSMHENVESGISGIREVFENHPVDVCTDGQGGAFVIVRDVDIGSAFAPAATWIGQAITYAYPDADVYPHWISPGVTLAASGGLPTGITAGHRMPGFDQPALQISRRSNRWNPEIDTAALKLLKVIAWLKSHQ